MSCLSILEVLTKERNSAMEGSLTMSQRERERLRIIDRIERRELTVVLAAESVGISERQMYRILKRYRLHGDNGLVHRLRGTHSNRGYPVQTRTTILRLYRERYGDYGPTLFSEMLDEHHNLTIDSETLRRWLRAGALWSSTRAKRPHRRKREPRERTRCHDPIRWESSRLVRGTRTHLLLVGRH